MTFLVGLFYHLFLDENELAIDATGDIYGCIGSLTWVERVIHLAASGLSRP